METLHFPKIHQLIVCSVFFFILLFSSLFLFTVTESLFAAGGYNTPTASTPYLPVTPLGLVAKNFHAAAASAAFSQVSITAHAASFTQTHVLINMTCSWAAIDLTRYQMITANEARGSSLQRV